jgi:hypothetical protein
MDVTATDAKEDNAGGVGRRVEPIEIAEEAWSI